MKKMKLWVSVLICICIVCTASSNVLASDDTAYAVSSVREEQRLVDEMIENAKVTEVSVNEIKLEKLEVISCREDKNGERIYEVAATTISVIPLTGELDSKIVEEATQAKSSGGSHYKYKWDNSLTAKLYCTVRYSVDSNDFVKITSVTGGYTGSGTNGALGSGVTFVSGNVRVGQNGRASGGAVVQSKSYAKNTKTWSITPPSTWQAVSLNNSATVGATYSVKLKRGTSGSWTTELVNNIVEGTVSVIPGR